MSFEHAERELDDDARAAWLTFVVIGAGATGVEMAGTMTEIGKSKQIFGAPQYQQKSLSSVC